MVRVDYNLQGEEVVDGGAVRLCAGGGFLSSVSGGRDNDGGLSGVFRRVVKCSQITACGGESFGAQQWVFQLEELVLRMWVEDRMYVRSCRLASPF